MTGWNKYHNVSQLLLMMRKLHVLNLHEVVKLYDLLSYKEK